MKKFLILHAGGLGDFILTWPGLMLLRRHFPNHHFVGVGRPEYLRLAVRMGYLDSGMDADSREMIPFFNGTDVPAGLTGLDGAVLWIRSADAAAGLLRRDSILPVVALEPFPLQGDHLGLHYCREIGKAFGFHVPEDIHSLFPLNTTANGPVFIHPGSGGTAKCFEPGFYLGLADRLRDLGFKDIRYILGPAEMERGMAPHFPAGQTVIPDNVSSLADTLSGAGLYIGNDSGPSHLAGVLGVRSIVIYINTDPGVWGAMGKGVRIIRSENDDDALCEIIRDMIPG
ncbi:glycosyltransferase family 9 protein [bacterium]|nr:glycosyltransferase family 9 protein [bacterium]